MPRPQKSITQRRGGRREGRRKMPPADVTPIPFFDLSDQQRLVFVAVSAGALLLCLGAILFIVLRLFRKQPVAAEHRIDELAIDISSLPTTPPPNDRPQPEFHITP